MWRLKNSIKLVVTVYKNESLSTTNLISWVKYVAFTTTTMPSTKILTTMKSITTPSMCPIISMNIYRTTTTLVSINYCKIGKDILEINLCARIQLLNPSFMILQHCTYFWYNESYGRAITLMTTTRSYFALTSSNPFNIRSSSVRDAPNVARLFAMDLILLI